jgi:hypothetical protein
MRHHKHHGPESTACTDNATVNRSIIVLSACSDKRACRVLLYLQLFHSGIHNRAAGLKAHKRTCAVTRSRPHQIVNHFLSSQHVLRKRLTVERSQQSLCLPRLFLVSRPFTSFCRCSSRLVSLASMISQNPLSLSSTAPRQPVSGQFPILKAAALACLPSGTSVPKRMLHVLLPYQFTLVLHSTSSTHLRTVPHFESSCPRLPAFGYLCPENNASRFPPTLISPYILQRSRVTPWLLDCPRSFLFPCSSKFQLGIQHFIRKGLNQSSGSSTRRRICGGNRP